MAAEVLTQYIFQAWCDNCAEGNEPGEAVDANQWMEAHNAEHHAAVAA